MPEHSWQTGTVVHFSASRDREMNQRQTEQFEEASGKYYAGHQEEAIQQIRDLVATLEDPRDRAGMRFHEVVWLAEMGNTHNGRAVLAELQILVAAIAPSPADMDEFEASVALAAMARFAEAKILLEEHRKLEALRVLEDLSSLFSKQLATSELRGMRNEIQLLRGTTLANLDRWAEVLPFLENAVVPDTWGGIVSYYIGRCYLEMKNDSAARHKLREALELGLSPQWEPRGHYALGLTEYNLSDFPAAKREFELCVKTADPEYLGQSKVWDWLAALSREKGRGGADSGSESEHGLKPRIN